MMLDRVNREDGGVLVTTLIVCMLVGIMLTAYLALVSQQQTFTQRSQVWNHCIPMCEAGVEEAMAHINHVGTTTDFAINGWKFENGAYRKERDLNNGTCLIAINTGLPPVITVSGGLRAPLHTMYVTRTIEVQTKFNQQFPNAILARGGVIMNGSARLDSFNSTNAQESTDGQYDPTKFTDRASVATTSQTPGDLNLGNVSLYGTVGTGPGGTVTVGPNGNVGSKGFNDNPAYNGLIEEGHSTDDVNVYIPPPGLPENWGEPTPPGPETIGTTKYAYVLRDGDYLISGNLSLQNKDTMIVLGKARLYVTGTTSIGGQAFIQLDVNGSIEFYAGGNVDLGGGGVVNLPGYAKRFSLVGLEGCLSVSQTGNSEFVGTIYAPGADIHLGGTADFVGAIVGKTITIKGNVDFHYDEALRTDPKRGRFFVHSWREL